MSAKKRKLNRKLATFRRLDATYMRRYLAVSPRRDPEKAARIWWRQIVPMGDALSRRFDQTWMVLDRCPAGTAVLVANYKTRTQV